jgi:hypothetical protein
MQAHSKSDPVTWPLRIFSPWLVATLGGLFIGTALLNLDRSDFPAGYHDRANRAATYDGPIHSPVHQEGHERDTMSEEVFEPAEATSVLDSRFDASVSFSEPAPRIEASASTLDTGAGAAH